MRVELAYGKGGLEVDLPGEVTLIEPRYMEGIPDERAAVRQALRHPVGTRPLRELATASDTVAVVTTDVTRATPNHKLLPWLLDELGHVPPERITIINGVGMHRKNTPEELEAMYGAAVVERYRCVNHDPHDPAGLVSVGRTRAGAEMLVNRSYVQASVRVVTGFIEPHFFAGFTGGPKGVMPGVCGASLIMRNHGAAMIAHPRATWGVTRGNPIFEEMLEVALRARPTFLLNVALNSRRAITAIFAGDLVLAHEAGCRFVKETAMQAVAAPFDVVVTTNSGYPLDLNLYQAVKGMAAAARIVKPGGAIVVAAECCDGIPDHGSYGKLLQMRDSPGALLKMIHEPDFALDDQWQVQIQAMIQEKARVFVYSCLAPEAVRRAQLEPCADIGATVRRLAAEAGPGARIAVLPYGPLTIPYLAAEPMVAAA
jgi:nickel-dependent lactate racemase